MASSSFSRFTCRSSLSSIKSAIKSNSPKTPFTKSPSSASSSSPRYALPSTPTYRFSSFSRIPSELGCVQSLLPLHSAVAGSRMTSCLSTTSSSRALSQGTLCCTSPGLYAWSLRTKVTGLKDWEDMFALED